MTDKSDDSERSADLNPSAEPEPASVGYAPGAGLSFEGFRKRDQHYNGWTNERVDYLKQRWAEGSSAGVIAAELGGITRNAVIGKIHRLGLHRSQRQPKEYIGRHPNARSHPVAQPARGKRYVIPWVEVPLVVDSYTEQTTTPVALLDLQPHQCRWPIGDGPFLFCAAETFLHFSYCLPHCSSAFRETHDTPRAERELRVRLAIRSYKKRKAA